MLEGLHLHRGDPPSPLASCSAMVVGNARLAAQRSMRRGWVFAGLQILSPLRAAHCDLPAAWTAPLLLVHLLKLLDSFVIVNQILQMLHRGLPVDGAFE